MSNTVIRVEHLSKSYHLGQIGTGTLSHDLNAWWAKVRGKPNPLAKVDETDHGNRYGETIWALNDVSFQVEKGEVLGVIGRNGAGKSTLLKILSRVTAPTSGNVKVKGKVASLLEVGTGFHPELTGRENIYLNGAILGMTRAEITRKFDEIVDFSGVAEFIDTPVKRYSSGMYVRLAFAVAAHLEPEILLVDEVLAVGDAEFQKKCLGKMGVVAAEGRTILYVSHNLGSLLNLCNQVVLFDQGKIIEKGNTSEVIGTYLSSMTAEVDSGGQVEWTDENKAPGGDEMSLQAIRIIGPDGKIQSIVDVNQPIHIEIFYRVKKALRGMRINLWILTVTREIAFITTDHDKRTDTIFQLGNYKSKCTIPGGLLNIGKYIIKVDCDIPGVKTLEPGAEYLSFITIGQGSQGSTFSETWPGVVCPKLDWEICVND